MLSSCRAVSRRVVEAAPNSLLDAKLLLLQRQAGRSITPTSGIGVVDKQDTQGQRGDLEICLGLRKGARGRVGDLTVLHEDVGSWAHEESTVGPDFVSPKHN